MSTTYKDQLIDMILVFGIHLHLHMAGGSPRWTQLAYRNKMCKEQPDRCFLLKIKNLRLDK